MLLTAMCSRPPGSLPPRGHASLGHLQPEGGAERRVVQHRRGAARRGPRQPPGPGHARRGISSRRSAVPYRDQVTHPAIDPTAPKLVYVQVADHITARIEAGELAPGAKLAAERDLAAEYGVSYDTIRRATALLRDRGLIITIVGRGTFVKPADE
jgi:GntR family transcriptional regulator